jgi:hypothetical protein
MRGGWLSKGKADLVADLVNDSRVYRLNCLTVGAVEKLFGG